MELAVNAIVRFPTPSRQTVMCNGMDMFFRRGSE